MPPLFPRCISLPKRALLKWVVILLVFPRASNTNPDPSLDHYSILYPQGTVNNMANDSGRQW